jgi:hypothetical protein
MRVQPAARPVLVKMISLRSPVKHGQRKVLVPNVMVCGGRGDHIEVEWLRVVVTARAISRTLVPLAKFI